MSTVHWRELFRKLASKHKHEVHAEAEDREDRTWVTVWLPYARPDFIQSRRWMP